jgi:hypothetical protein
MVAEVAVATTISPLEDLGTLRICQDVVQFDVGAFAALVNVTPESDREAWVEYEMMRVSKRPSSRPDAVDTRRGLLGCFDVRWPVA